jgi:hypothetical protein
VNDISSKPVTISVKSSLSTLMTTWSLREVPADQAFIHLQKSPHPITTPTSKNSLVTGFDRGGDHVHHLFQVTFAMAHNMTCTIKLIGESMEVASITIAVPAAPSTSTPPLATIALGSGKQITFPLGSVAVVSRMRYSAVR